MYLGQKSGEVFLCGGRRLGAASATGEEVGAAIVKAAPAAGPFAPIVAAVGSVAEAIFSFVGGGCGQACVLSATAEQVFEVACDDIEAVGRLGMIGQADYQSAIQEIINAGIAKLQQLEASGDKKAAAGVINLQASTTGNVSFGETLPAAPTVAMNLAQAQAAFKSPTASGWEPTAITSGNNLAAQVLQTIASSPTTTAAGSVAGLVSGTVAGLPGWLVLGGGALLAWAVLR
jgi:hypothetical protein